MKYTLIACLMAMALQSKAQKYEWVIEGGALLPRPVVQQFQPPRTDTVVSIRDRVIEVRHYFDSTVVDTTTVQIVSIPLISSQYAEIDKAPYNNYPAIRQYWIAVPRRKKPF